MKLLSRVLIAGFFLADSSAITLSRANAGSVLFGGQQESTQEYDEKTITWYLTKRPNETDSYAIQQIENRFFEYWETKRLDRLIRSSDKTLTIPAVWRQTKRTIFDGKGEPDRELEFFLGFFAGKNDLVINDSFRKELIKHFRCDREKRVFYFDKKANQSSIFELQQEDYIIEGRFPLLAGTPESKVGHIEKRIDDEVVWTKDIPMPKTLGNLKGTWTPEPNLASVFYSTGSIFIAVVFDIRIFVYEFELASGKHNRTYCFD